MAKRKKKKLKVSASPDVVASCAADVKLTKKTVEPTEAAAAPAEAAAEPTEAAAAPAEVVAEPTEATAAPAEAAAEPTEATAAPAEAAAEPTEAAAASAEVAVELTEAAAASAEVVAEPTETVAPAGNKGGNGSVVGMALTAAVLIVAIGCWGYFVTPKLGSQPAQQQRVSARQHSGGDTSANKLASKDASDKGKQQIVKEPPKPEHEERQDEPIDEVKLSDKELALLEPPIYRQVNDPNLQKDIIVSQYMYARDYLSFAGMNVGRIDELDKKAQEAAQSGSGDDELLVRQASEAAAKMLSNFFNKKLKSSKVQDKEKLAKEAEQYFQSGDLSNGIVTYEKACGLGKKVQSAGEAK